MATAAARLLIRGGERLLPGGARHATDVLIEDGTIRSVEAGAEHRGATVWQADRCLIAPGFVDVHVHGAGGDVFEQGSRDGNARISALLARHGTVAVVATLATLPRERLREAVAAIAAVRGREPGARVVGIHLEGPFLNPRRAGAQNPAWMRAPSISEVDELQRIGDGLITMVTVAPELDGATPFIRALRQRGLTVALGHTEATTGQVDRAIEAGATHVTHLFNAMSPLHHREPGTVGVGLTNDALTVEIICDGHHLDARAVELVFRCKPADRIALVSDAVAAGMRDGAHELFGVRCAVRAGAVRTESGQLAGSCLTLDAAVRNVRRWRPALAWAEILACASAVPARIAKLAPGSISVGAPADLIVLNDDMRVAATVVTGREAWRDAGIVAAQG